MGNVLLNHTTVKWLIHIGGDGLGFQTATFSHSETQIPTSAWERNSNLSLYPAMCLSNNGLITLPDSAKDKTFNCRRNSYVITCIWFFTGMCPAVSLQRRLGGEPLVTHAAGQVAALVVTLHVAS